jgi:hypothetical protein
MDETILITDNFLVGLTKRPDVLLRFPFLKQLSIKTSMQAIRGCGSCNAKSVNRKTITMVSEVKRILATMQESEVKVFKEMLNIPSYRVKYEHRNQQTTITR